MMMNLIPTWKLSRQIATIYLQTTHCQFLVLFFSALNTPKKVLYLILNLTQSYKLL